MNRFVFQNFQLLPTLTAVENVMISLELRGEKGLLAKAKDLLGRVGLGDRVDHYPLQLSGGEQQRVAMARAFFSSPQILFADEPTGNLDTKTSREVIGLFDKLNKERNLTVILVTHDQEVARYARRTIVLRDGIVICDTADFNEALKSLHSYEEFDVTE